MRPCVCEVESRETSSRHRAVVGAGTEAGTGAGTEAGTGARPWSVVFRARTVTFTCSHVATDHYRKTRAAQMTLTSRDPGSLER